MDDSTLFFPATLLIGLKELQHAYDKHSLLLKKVIKVIEESENDTKPKPKLKPEPGKETPPPPIEDAEGKDKRGTFTGL